MLAIYFIISIKEGDVLFSGVIEHEFLEGGNIFSLNFVCIFLTPLCFVGISQNRGGNGVQPSALHLGGIKTSFT